MSIANAKAAASEIDNLIAKGILNEPGTITKKLDGGAIFKATDDYASEPVNPVIYNTGFGLGTFCTPEIQSATTDVLSSILKVIDFKSKLDGVPANFKDSVFINVFITGKADGNKVIRGKDGKCTLKYKDEVPIYGRYYAKDDRTFKTPIKVGINKGDAICDEELAFLRANCAYLQVLRIIKDAHFPEANVRPKLIVQVSDEKGPEFRGVNVDLQVENLFLYKLEAIKALQTEKEITDRRITVLKKELAENDKKISDISDPLVRVDKVIKDKVLEIEELHTDSRKVEIKSKS